MLKPIVFGSWFVYYGLNLTEVIEKYCINKDKPELNCDGKCYLSEKLGLDTTSKEEPKLIINEAFQISYLQFQEDVFLENPPSEFFNHSFSYDPSYTSLVMDVPYVPPKQV